MPNVSATVENVYFPLFWAVVQEIGPVRALIDVGSKSYKAETKAGVAKFTELSFVVVTDADPNCT